MYRDDYWVTLIRERYYDPLVNSFKELLLQSNGWMHGRLVFYTTNGLTFIGKPIPGQVEFRRTRAKFVRIKIIYIKPKLSEFVELNVRVSTNHVLLKIDR